MPRVMVVVVFDCLRADHSSAYGYSRATTPTLERLADKGILWEEAHSTAPWTKPSVTSMFTGLYPTQHGAFEGIKRNRASARVTTDVLSSSYQTLAERLSAHGWRCGAFINNAQLGEFSGLQRGFDYYNATIGKADHLLATFRQWIEQGDSRPVFAYLHFLEAHWPYKPRRRHIEMFGGNRDTNYFRDFSARDFGRLRRAISRGEDSLSETQVHQMIQMYDGAVRRLDGKLKTLLSTLSDNGLTDDTALFVTADHGEEFLDHHKIGHGQALYQELVHVPLVAVIPGGPSGVRLRNPVSLVDLPDTLLRLAGAADSDAADLLGDPSAARPVISELRVRNRYAQSLRVGDWKLHRQYRFEDNEGTGGPRTPVHRLLERVDADVTQELYNLSDDPHEQNDRSADRLNADVLKDLQSSLDTWWQDATPDPDQTQDEIELSGEITQRLRALGYVE